MALAGLGNWNAGSDGVGLNPPECESCYTCLDRKTGEVAPWSFKVSAIAASSDV